MSQADVDAILKGMDARLATLLAAIPGNVWGAQTGKGDTRTTVLALLADAADDIDAGTIADRVVARLEADAASSPDLQLVRQAVHDELAGVQFVARPAT